jgi:hypothetical protein
VFYNSDDKSISEISDNLAGVDLSGKKKSESDKNVPQFLKAKVSRSNVCGFVCNKFDLKFFSAIVPNA